MGRKSQQPMVVKNIVLHQKCYTYANTHPVVGFLNIVIVRPNLNEYYMFISNLIHTILRVKHVQRKQIP